MGYKNYLGKTSQQNNEKSRAGYLMMRRVNNYIYKTNINRDKALQAQREGKTVRNIEALQSVPVNNIPIEHFSVDNLERIGRDIQGEEKNRYS